MNGQDPETDPQMDSSLIYDSGVPTERAAGTETERAVRCKAQVCSLNVTFCKKHTSIPATHLNTFLLCSLVPCAFFNLSAYPIVEITSSCVSIPSSQLVAWYTVSKEWTEQKTPNTGCWKSSQIGAAVIVKNKSSLELLERNGTSEMFDPFCQL